MLFISCRKLFSFLRYLGFCPNFYGHVGKWLDEKAKVNFKYYGATDWTIVNCYTNTAQYFKE